MQLPNMFVTRLLRCFIPSVLIALICSCSTSNNVVNNHVFQKRKYNKGFHVTPKGQNDNRKDLPQEKTDGEWSVTPMKDRIARDYQPQARAKSEIRKEEKQVHAKKKNEEKQASHATKIDYLHTQLSEKMKDRLEDVVSINELRQRPQPRRNVASAEGLQEQKSKRFSTNNRSGDQFITVLLCIVAAAVILLALIGLILIIGMVFEGIANAVADFKAMDKTHKFLAIFFISAVLLAVIIGGVMTRE